MIFTALLLVITAGVHSISHFNFMKASAFSVPSHSLCCPVGWSLHRTKLDQFGALKFDCIPEIFVPSVPTMHPSENLRLPYINTTETTTTTTTSTTTSTTTTKSPATNRDKSSTLNFYNIPKCENFETFALTSQKDFQLAPGFCFFHDAAKKTWQILSCRLQDSQQTIWLSVLHKCCPVGKIYSHSQRRCITDTLHLSQAHFRRVTANTIILQDDAMHCPRHKVMVEYQLTENDFSFADGELRIHHLPAPFKNSDYCVEPISKDAPRMQLQVPNENETIAEAVDTNISTTEAIFNAPLADFLHETRTANFLVRTCDKLATCKYLPCIRRCCREGEIYSRGNATSYCKRDDVESSSFHSFESLNLSGLFEKPPVFGILRGLDCLKYRLNPDEYADEAHNISSKDGSIHVTTTQKKYSNYEYCVEQVRSSELGNEKFYTFLCFDSKVVGNDRIRFKMYPIGLLISCCFYAMTLLVYISIPKLRNLPGKILICLVSSLLAAYFAIALGQLMPTPNDDICFLSGFLVYFCLIAAFAWMNIMCYDIWQTFGSTRRSLRMKEDNQTKQFLIYSSYGWGLPTLLTIITICFAKTNWLSEKVRPHFGNGRCWFTYDTLTSANLIFFSGPVGILFLINFVLFMMTLRYCNKVKREIYRMQSSNMEKPALRKRFFMEKARFVMNTKLFIVMGTTWLLEILSILFYDHKKTFFWIISDSFNVLMGVLVFFIFVFKKRVWQTLLIKIGMRKETNSLNLTSMQATSMTRINLDASSSLLSNQVNVQRFPSTT